MRSETIGVILALCVNAASAQVPTATEVVEAYVAAYNEQDVESMLSLVTEDVRWMTVDGVRIRLESVGKEALGAGVAAYFTNLPSARSVLRSLDAAGDFVTAIEKATWVSDGETRSQCAVSVYQLRDELIMAVWYFSAQPCDDEPGA